MRALSPAALAQLEARIAPAASTLAAALPIGEPVDLLEFFAKPWALHVASISADRCERPPNLARALFDTASEPYDDALAAAAQKSTVQLATFVQSAPPWHMQMFVALAHSLPTFLGNAWLALI